MFLSVTEEEDVYEVLKGEKWEEESEKNLFTQLRSSFRCIDSYIVFSLDSHRSNQVLRQSGNLFFSLALNGGGHIFFRSPSSPLFSLPACSLVSSRNTWETLSALLSKTGKKKSWIWSTGLSTQLTPSSRREARVRGNLTALTERSQLATRWTRGTGGVSCV